MSSYQRFPYDSFAGSNLPRSSVPKSHLDLQPHEHNNAQFQSNQNKVNFPMGATNTPEHVEAMSSYPRAPIDFSAEQSFVSVNISHNTTPKSQHDLQPHENNNAQFQPHPNINNFPIGNATTPEQESFHLHRMQNPPYYPSAIEHPTTIEAHPIPSAPPPNLASSSPNYLNVELSNPPYPPRKHNVNHDKPSVNRESQSPVPPPAPPPVERHKLKNPYSVGCIRYGYEALKAVTHNFDDTKYSLGGYLLGEGGFGPVYLGYLCSTEVAIKVLQNASTGRQVYKGDEQFVTEISVLTRYRHVNLLTLMGYSDDGPSRCIVYEFMCNGTLEDWLEGKKYPLHWTSRHSILRDTARGLLYLHQADPDHPLIHRDVKTANVLLDSSMQAKVGDFGLARQTDINIENKTGTILGTSGYIPPEYYAGNISIKTDVYAFGVVVLEVLTGLASFDGRREPKELVSRMRRTIEKGHKEMLRWVDQNSGDWPSGAYFEMSKLAWNSLSNSPVHRPDMAKVLQSIQQIHLDNQISKAITPRYN